MRFVVLALALVAAGCLQSPVETAGTESVSDGATWTTSIVDADVRRTGEPSMAIAPDGTIFVCAPAGAQAEAAARDHNFVWRSDDDGATFALMPTTGREDATGGGDCDLAIDDAGSLHMLNLYGGPFPVPWAITYAASDDGGETWRDAKTVSNVPVNDRQWITTHDGVVYITWQQVDTGIWVGKSTDGGRTFIATLAMPRYANAGLQRYFIEGPIRVSPVDGTVYVPDGSMNGLDFWGVPNPTPLHDAHGNVAVSEDGGLTWTIKRADGVPTGWAFAVDRAGTLWTGQHACDVDGAGNVTGCVSQIWSSRDKATTWEGPVNVTTPVALRLSHLWIAAGSDGRVALGMYGSEKLDFAAEDKEGDWHLYVAGTTDAGATWSFERVTSEPVHQGVLARDLVDYLSVVIHTATGLPHVAYTTTYNKTEDDGPYGWIGHAQATGGVRYFTDEDLDGGLPAQKNRRSELNVAEPVLRAFLG